MLASLLLVTLAATYAHAHSVVQEIIIDGQGQGFGKGVRIPAKNSPVTDVNSADIICNANLKDPLPEDVLTVAPGGKVGANWHRTIGKLDSEVISQSHMGPIGISLAKVELATQPDVSGLKWFKVAEQGFDPARGKWATDDLIANKGVFEFEVPTCIAPGQYIMRADLIALHNARPGKGGAQIYIGCAQLNIEGGDGTTEPETFELPGAYSPDEEGLNTNPFQQKDSEYPIPGPKLFTCDGNNPNPIGPGTSSAVIGSPTQTEAPAETGSEDVTAPVSEPTSKASKETGKADAASLARRDTRCRAKRGHA